MGSVDKPPSALHGFGLIAFSAALFLPLIGRGFVLDDFGHAFVVQHESLRFGLTHASGGPYYAPLAWLSFKLDWLVWGLRPYMWAVTNLLIHVINTLLLYALAKRLWRSPGAAWWTAMGFALLYPATVAAMLFIAVRAHLLTAMFCLIALNLALLAIRADHKATIYALATVAAGVLAMFSKESGSTVIGAIAIIFLYERIAHGRKPKRILVVSIFAGLIAGLALYLAFRSQSGATPISFGGHPCCSYALSLKVLGNNLLLYGLRTYGLLAIPALAILIATFIRARGIVVGPVSKYDFLLSASLFGTALTPFLLLRNDQGMYSYLPGVGAALMLGLFVKMIEDSRSEVSPIFKFAALAPLILAVVMLTGLTIEHSRKWIQLAEVNASVMKQIQTQQPTVPSNTFFRLEYSETDFENRFPEGFGDWCFPYALRVIYGDRTLDGAIMRRGDPEPKTTAPAEVRFAYVAAESPMVLKTSELYLRHQR